MNIDEILKMGDNCRKFRGVPTKLHISQLLSIIEYYSWYQINAKTYNFHLMSDRKNNLNIHKF